MTCQQEKNMTLLLIFLACGEKEEDSALTEPTSEPSEDISSEETGDTGAEDTAVEETPETSEFKTNDELGVCYLNDEVI